MLEIWNSTSSLSVLKECLLYCSIKPRTMIAGNRSYRERKKKELNKPRKGKN